MILSAFLSKRPAPATVTVDGKALAVPAGRKRWAALAATIEGMSPRTGAPILALDAAGTVLRAMAWGEDDEPEADEPEAPPAETELAQLARIITVSNDAAVQRQTEMMRPFLEAQSQILTQMTAQVGALMGAWVQQAQMTAEANAALIEERAQAAAEQEGDPLKQMVGAFVSGAAGNLMPAKPAGKKGDA